MWIDGNVIKNCWASGVLWPLFDCRKCVCKLHYAPHDTWMFVCRCCCCWSPLRGSLIDRSVCVIVYRNTQQWYTTNADVDVAPLTAGVKQQFKRIPIQIDISRKKNQYTMPDTYTQRVLGNCLWPSLNVDCTSNTAHGFVLFLLENVETEEERRVFPLYVNYHFQ